MRLVSKTLCECIKKQTHPKYVTKDEKNIASVLQNHYAQEVTTINKKLRFCF